jgi:anti-anti-sigma factor
MAELDSEHVAEIAIDAAVDASGVTIVTLSGELDSSNVDALETVVNPILAQSPERLAFQATDLRFIDSAGIAVLIRAAATVPTVELRDPSAIVRRVIEITALSDILRVQP